MVPPSPIRLGGSRAHRRNAKMSAAIVRSTFSPIAEGGDDADDSDDDGDNRVTMSSPPPPPPRLSSATSQPCEPPQPAPYKAMFTPVAATAAATTATGPTSAGAGVATAAAESGEARCDIPPPETGIRTRPYVARLLRGMLLPQPRERPSAREALDDLTASGSVSGTFSLGAPMTSSSSSSSWSSSSSSSWSGGGGDFCADSSSDSLARLAALGLHARATVDGVSGPPCSRSTLGLVRRRTCGAASARVGGRAYSTAAVAALHADVGRWASGRSTHRLGKVSILVGGSDKDGRGGGTPASVDLADEQPANPMQDLQDLQDFQQRQQEQGQVQPPGPTPRAAPAATEKGGEEKEVAPSPMEDAEGGREDGSGATADARLHFGAGCKRDLPACSSAMTAPRQWGWVAKRRIGEALHEDGGRRHSF